MGQLSSFHHELLRLVCSDDGEWSWYQLDRAFDVSRLPDGVRFIDLLRQLESGGFIVATETEPGMPSKVHIFDEVASIEGTARADRRGIGERHSLTAHAIEGLTSRYRRRFGQDVDGLQGTLAESNKLNFQREYHRLTQAEGLAKDDAALAAIKNISFGCGSIGTTPPFAFSIT